MPSDLPRRQRVAAYAVIVRGDQMLLSRLAPSIAPDELWTLPGGGIDFGEHPADAVVREVYEETGLEATVGQPLWIGSARRPVDLETPEVKDLHSVRLVYEAAVATDSPPPRVVEVDGSTVDARWFPVAEVVTGAPRTVPMVCEALASCWPRRHQRVAAYALVRRGDTVLLTRLSATAAHPGAWTLPGGGIDHGEAPAQAAAREVREETGLTAEVGDLLTVHDTHFTGTAPDGRTEDFHGVQLIFAATVYDGRLEVQEVAGTSDAAAWVPVADVHSGAVDVLDVVRAGLAAGT